MRDHQTEDRTDHEFQIDSRNLIPVDVNSGISLANSGKTFSIKFSFLRSEGGIPKFGSPHYWLAREIYCVFRFKHPRSRTHRLLVQAKEEEDSS